MSEPKPTPADPKKEGGTPPQTSPTPAQESGMLNEGEGSAQPRDDRRGGMIGEG